MTIQGGAGNDESTLAGTDLQYLRGLKILAGEGPNTLQLSTASSRCKSFSYTGGADLDNVIINGSSLTVSGPTTLALGDGANSLSGGPAVGTYLGAVKVTGGADDETLSIAASSLRLAKGATIDGGIRR